MNIKQRKKYFLDKKSKRKTKESTKRIIEAILSIYQKLLTDFYSDAIRIEQIYAELFPLLNKLMKFAIKYCIAENDAVKKYFELVAETIKFLNDIVVNPNVEGNAFNKKCFQVIKEGIKNQIESIKENTRKLSMINMLDNMGDDVYSYHTFGYLDDLNSITPESIYEYYKEFIRTSNIDIYVLGNIDFEETKKLVSNNFKFNTLKMKKCDPFIYHNKFRKIPKKVIDKMPLSQSKLSIGCKIDELSAYERNYVLPIYSILE